MPKFWSTMAQQTEPYVPGEQLRKKDMIKLNTNENPYPPSQKVVSRIKQAAMQGLQLYPAPAADSLRSKIAANVGLNKENIFVGNGSDEVLAFSFMAFFEPGKTIRFPAITYSFYPVYCKLFGIPYEEIDLAADFSLLPAPYYQAEGGVIFPNPNAPTGIYLELEYVVKIIENNPDSVVIVDEAYIDFAGKSAASLITEYDNLLVIQTMSKSRSLAGLRVGFAMGNQHLIEALMRIKDSFNSYTLDKLAIAGAEAALDNPVYFSETVKKIIQTRTKTAAKIEQHGFHVLPSQANFIFVSHQSIEAKTLYEKLKENGILIRHFNNDLINHYLRITIGTDDEMDIFFKRLEAVLADLQP